MVEEPHVNPYLDLNNEDLIKKTMAFENRRWLVIPTSIIDDINCNEVLESKKESLRKSLDNSLTFVKYTVNVVEETYTETHANPETGEDVTTTIEAGVYGRPSVYNGTYTEYNHVDMLALLSTEAWTSNDTE
jgi:hypothetical protein